MVAYFKYSAATYFLVTIYSDHTTKSCKSYVKLKTKLVVVYRDLSNNFISEHPNRLFYNFSSLRLTYILLSTKSVSETSLILAQH